jgi:hypothetical protein
MMVKAPDRSPVRCEKKHGRQGVSVPSPARLLRASGLLPSGSFSVPSLCFPVRVADPFFLSPCFRSPCFRFLRLRFFCLRSLISVPLICGRAPHRSRVFSFRPPPDVSPIFWGQPPSRPLLRPVPPSGTPPKRCFGARGQSRLPGGR